MEDKKCIKKGNKNRGSRRKDGTKKMSTAEAIALVLNPLKGKLPKAHGLCLRTDKPLAELADQGRGRNKRRNSQHGMGVTMTFDDVLQRMAAIHQAKNADYGSSYNLAPALLGIPAHVGILVRMTDKLARACKLAQGEKAQVQDGALTDTLFDLANYAVLAILALESPGGSPRSCSPGT